MYPKVYNSTQHAKVNVVAIHQDYQFQPGLQGSFVYQRLLNENRKGVHCCLTIACGRLSCRISWSQPDADPQRDPSLKMTGWSLVPQGRARPSACGISCNNHPLRAEISSKFGSTSGCRNSFSSDSDGKATRDDLHRKNWDGSSCGLVRLRLLSNCPCVPQGGHIGRQRG